MDCARLIRLRNALISSAVLLAAVDLYLAYLALVDPLSLIPAIAGAIATVYFYVQARSVSREAAVVCTRRR
ncbi:MAG: hypothetical protein QW680_13085 [Pyrobaculum sp.]